MPVIKWEWLLAGGGGCGGPPSCWKGQTCSWAAFSCDGLSASCSSPLESRFSPTCIQGLPSPGPVCCCRQQESEFLWVLEHTGTVCETWGASTSSCLRGNPHAASRVASSLHSDKRAAFALPLINNWKCSFLCRLVSRRASVQLHVYALGRRRARSSSWACASSSLSSPSWVPAKPLSFDRPDPS